MLPINYSWLINHQKGMNRAFMNHYNDFCRYVRNDESFIPKTARSVYNFIDNIMSTVYLPIYYAHEKLKEIYLPYTFLSYIVTSMYNENANKVIDYLEKQGVDTEFLGNVIDTLKVLGVSQSFGKSLKIIKAETKLLNEANQIKKAASVKIESIKTNIIDKNKCNKLKCKRIVEKYAESTNKEIDKMAYLHYQETMKKLDHKFADEYLKLQNNIKQSNKVKEIIMERFAEKIIQTNFDWKNAFLGMVADDFADKLINSHTLTQLYDESLTDMKTNINNDYNSTINRFEMIFKDNYPYALYSLHDENPYLMDTIDSNFSFKDMCDNLDKEDVTEPIFCHLNELGIPVEPINDTDYTISGFSKKDICKIYWTLRGITVKYTFTVNYISVSRTISVHTNMIPRYRIYGPIELYTAEYDPEFETSYTIKLQLDSIYKINDGNYGLRLLIMEIDCTDAIQFISWPYSDMSNIYCEYKFLNNTCFQFLNYNPDVVCMAMINNFDIEFQFFE